MTNNVPSISTLDSCQSVAKRMGASDDSPLSAIESSALEAHLLHCQSCHDSVKRFRAMQGLLQGTFEVCKLSPEFSEKTGNRIRAKPFLTTMDHVSFEDENSATMPETDKNEVPLEESLTNRLGAAPWWAVSVLLHVLIIALASLVSMAIAVPDSGDAVIMITDLSTRPEVVAEVEKPKTQDPSALESKHDTPPTDLTSKEASDIVVPADILAKAELGDHFETVNLDRPDTQSAFGNPDAHMFHSVKGNDEPEGGGGVGGTGLDELIGMGGLSSKGTGGGWGGGNGTGAGMGMGSGSGSFGQRGGGGRRLMVKKHGGSKATESAVDLALQWLAYHQEADGHWDSKKYGAGGRVDTAMTGLALLSFLGAGHTEKVGLYKENVQRAVQWLINSQDDSGRPFQKGDVLHGDGDLKFHAGPGYSVAIATIALAEAAGMSNLKTTREAAQKAVNYCTEDHQQGEGSDKGAWRYNKKADPDISLSGWFVMALKSAKVAGLHVNPASFDGAMKVLDSLEIKVHVKDADEAYGLPSLYNYMAGKDNNSNPRRCAIGNLCRQFMGVKKEDLQSSVELFVKKGGVPNWPANEVGPAPLRMPTKGAVDLYYWYYGSLCVFQQGGELWKQWNEGLKGALLPNQCKVGDDTGSWHPTGDNAEKWGRVGQTALSALCLEVYYRYVQLQN